MGWTFTNRAKGTPIKKFLEEEVFGPRFEVLGCAVVKRRTAYVAARNLDNPEVVFACVFLLEYRPKDYGYEFGYKDIDETMGPYAYECPEKILDLLTPTDHEYALKWRAACRERLAKKKAAPTVVPGDRVVFASPIRFTNGAVLDRFILRSRGRTGKGRYFEAYDKDDDGLLGYYTITGWRTMDFTVVEKGAAA